MINSFSGYNRFLSNFYEVDVFFDGDLYPSVEHAYQAAKTDDLEYRQLIKKALTPAKAKSIGRVVPLRDNWEFSKLDIMKDLLQQKFSQEPFKTKLLATGDKQLIEGNYWGDIFWGQDLQGKGLNHLGKLLMEVRDEIKEV